MIKFAISTLTFALAAALVLVPVTWVFGIKTPLTLNESVMLFSGIGISVLGDMIRVLISKDS